MLKNWREKALMQEKVAPTLKLRQEMSVPHKASSKHQLF
jgi:hypothetical protein